MDSFTLIIFGITSNLAQLKLIPALYDICSKGLLPENTSIIGIARSPKSKEEFDKFLSQTLHSENKHHQHPIDEKILRKLQRTFYYLDGHIEDPTFYPKLKNFLHTLSRQGSNSHNKIFYLATYPHLYAEIFKCLDQSGLSSENEGWTRIMIEKPIGTNLRSAIELNGLFTKFFREDQIYRLDHYLGKETLQNILAFRFGNGLFEPVMNRNYIDHIEITALEDFGIGKRGGYYDSVGALKDVGQNHLLQMITFATMDAPSEFTNREVTAKRIQVLHSLKAYPKSLVLGQYSGYQREEHVKPNSQTDTFFTFKTEVQNERFKGVPIFVRGGKKLTQTTTEISIIFKNPTNRLFSHLKCGNEPNILTYRIQPNEGIGLQILSKIPGHSLELEPTFMQFCYKTNISELPDPYERLIVDAIRGDATFFNDSEEIEAEWKFIDQLEAEHKKPAIYQPGTYGPREADEMIARENHCWLIPSNVFCAV